MLKAYLHLSDEKMGYGKKLLGNILLVNDAGILEDFRICYAKEAKREGLLFLDSYKKETFVAPGTETPVGQCRIQWFPGIKKVGEGLEAYYAEIGVTFPAGYSTSEDDMLCIAGVVQIDPRIPEIIVPISYEEDAGGPVYHTFKCYSDGLKLCRADESLEGIQDSARHHIKLCHTIEFQVPMLQATITEAPVNVPYEFA